MLIQNFKLEWNYYHQMPPFGKKKEGGVNSVLLFISFLLHYSSLSFYGTIMPNRWPQSTFPQQEKHIQCCYILGHNNSAHKHFTKRKFMYNTATYIASRFTGRMNFSRKTYTTLLYSWSLQWCLWTFQYMMTLFIHNEGFIILFFSPTRPF